MSEPRELRDSDLVGLGDGVSVPSRHVEPRRFTDDEVRELDRQLRKLHAGERARLDDFNEIPSGPVEDVSTASSTSGSE